LLNNRLIDKDAAWFASFPLYFETPRFLISHRSVSHTGDPFNTKNEDDLVRHRNKIKRPDQLQIYGHTLQKEAIFELEANTIKLMPWHIRLIN
jgi:hypothetical protein